MLSIKSAGGHIAEFGSTSSPTSPMTYDAAGNRTSMYVSDIANAAYSGTTNYSYDYKDELTQELTSRNSGSTNTFAYDTAGNFTTIRNATVPAPNTDNQLTSSGYSYDGDGNPVSYGGTTLQFDPESRMASYGSAETDGYDLDGLRVWRNQSGTTTYYVYDDDNPVVELSSTGAFVALNTFGEDGLVSRATGTATSAKHFYTFDPQGSPAVIYDGAGNQLAAAETDAFGKTVYTTNVSSDPYAGFGSQWGYYTDSATGLELLGHRYYDPNTGRFINRDPLSYDGGFDLYEYCANNPAIKTDSSGLAVYFCYRPVVTNCNSKSLDHWFLDTGCGTYGYGPHGVIIGNLANLGSYGAGDETCTLISASSAQEQCLCDKARSAKSGGTVCNRRWTGKPGYGWGGLGSPLGGHQPNCQDFANCLLKSCGLSTQHPTYCEIY